jgi:hypothetical protein
LKGSSSGLFHHPSALHTMTITRSKEERNRGKIKEGPRGGHKVVYLPSASSISSLRNMCAKDRRSSTHARLIPRHMRGPRENDTSQFSSAGSSSHRSGRNSCGEGKRVELKWTKPALQDTIVYTVQCQQFIRTLSGSGPDVKEGRSVLHREQTGRKSSCLPSVPRAAGQTPRPR